MNKFWKWYLISMAFCGISAIMAYCELNVIGITAWVISIIIFMRALMFRKNMFIDIDEITNEVTK
jgi:hypothetical protein